MGKDTTMLAKTPPQYAEMPFKAPTKQGINVISMMPSYRILWFLLRRHKVGILATLAVVGFTYDNLLPFVARELFALLFR